MHLVNHPGFPVSHFLLKASCHFERLVARTPGVLPRAIGKAGLSVTVKHSENWNLTSDPELAPCGIALLGSGPQKLCETVNTCLKAAKFGVVYYRAIGNEHQGLEELKTHRSQGAVRTRCLHV